MKLLNINNLFAIVGLSCGFYSCFPQKKSVEFNLESARGRTGLDFDFDITEDMIVTCVDSSKTPLPASAIELYQSGWNARVQGASTAAIRVLENDLKKGSNASLLFSGPSGRTQPFLPVSFENKSWTTEQIFVFRSPRGLKIWTKCKQDNSVGVFACAQTPPKETKLTSFNGKRNLPEFEPKTLAYLPNFKNLDAFSARLVASAHSTNPQIPTLDYLKQAYLRMLLKIIEKSKLTAEDLENWNLIASEPKSSSAQHLIAAGILRGSRKSLVVDGKSVTADLTKCGIALGKLTLAPPEEVSKGLLSILAEVNKIDRKSKPIEIANLYQEFILVHPFIDGNGTTARILLDFMFLKAGFAPIKHTAANRDVLYRTPEEITHLWGY